MALPTSPTNSWMQSLDLPSRIFGDEFSGNDFELYEEDDEFVLTVDVPGYEQEEIDLAWDNGVLNVAAEHVDEERGRKKTYHRRFRFPKEVHEDAIKATYRNGVLEVTLPLMDDAVTRGKTIPIEGE